MWWVLWHVTLVRPLCDGQHPTAGRGGCRVPRPGRSGDTPADTRVDTVDTRNTCDHSVANFVATILFVLLDVFLGFAFSMKIILNSFLEWLQIIDRGPLPATIYAAESPVRAIVSQQRRGVTQHIRTFQVPSQDTGPAQAPQQLSVSFTTSLSGCDVIMQTSSFIQVPGPYFLPSVLNTKKQKLNMNNVLSCDIPVMLLLFNKVL